MKYLKALFSWLGKNKSKLFVGILSFAVFAVLLFPFSDLSDVLGAKISEMTQGQLFVRFGHLNLSFWPHPGIQFGNLAIETPMTGTIEATELTVSPSPSVLFSTIPYGSMSAKGLFKGDVDVKMTSGTKSESGVERQRFEVHARSLNLADLVEVANLPMILKGKLNLESKGQIDLGFADQPDADFFIKAEKFEFPSQAINTMMGPLNLPDLRLSNVEIKGKLSGGKFVIEDGNIGGNDDELHGKVTGNISLGLHNQNGLQTQVGPYMFDVDLVIKSGLEEKLNLFLAVISQYKTATENGSRYQLRLTAQDPSAPPAMSGLH